MGQKHADKSKLSNEWTAQKKKNRRSRWNPWPDEITTTFLDIASLKYIVSEILKVKFKEKYFWTFSKFKNGQWPILTLYFLAWKKNRKSKKCERNGKRLAETNLLPLKKLPCYEMYPIVTWQLQFSKFCFS